MKVEKKTAVGVLVTALIGFLIAVLNGVQDNPGMLGSLPVLLQGLILTVVPALVTFVAQYQTPTTIRTDPAAQQQALEAGLEVVPLRRAA